MTRRLDELVDTQDPAWPLVQSWLASARNPIEVLPVERARGEMVLLALQVTTRSPMGAIALETAGIFVDHGWLRLLGAGSDRMLGGLDTWNGLSRDIAISPLFPGACVVAHDAAGGFFAANGGAFKGPRGNVFYFATDALEWIDCQKSYSDFVRWALNGNLDQFYEVERWPGWQQDLRTLTGDQGFSIYPPLWSQEGRGGNRSRRAVPMAELWRLYVNG
jgi:hypothetical protein